jgi:hypothetical protein
MINRLNLRTMGVEGGAEIQTKSIENLFKEGLGPRWWIRRIHHFDSMNEKSQVTRERLYSEDRKRGKSMGITKEVSGEQKSMKKHKQQIKAANSSKPHFQLPGRRGS